MAADDTEATPSQQRGLVPWLPGQSGNPAGRPKGSRNKLGEAFIAALHDDFQEHGTAVIAKVRETDPVAYVKVCASILPKELNVTVDQFDGLSDAELDKRIRQLAVLIGLEIGAGEAPASPATEAGAEPPSSLSTLQ